MSDARIRLAGASDWQALAEMRYRFRAEAGGVNETESQFVERCAEWMKKHFHSPAWRCWIFEEDKQLRGHVCVHLFEKIPNPVDEAEVHAYVTNCYVVPESRNQEIGKKLLEKALAWCRSEGVDAVILWPTDPSRSFYQRFGFAGASDIFELRESGSRQKRS